jgi:hypothetical protein
MPDDDKKNDEQDQGQPATSNNDEKKGAGSDNEEPCLSELLGVENLGQIFYTDKNGNLYGAAGKDFGIAKLEHDGSLNFQAPDKAPSQSIGEEIRIRADEYGRRFLSDGKIWTIQGMTYTNHPIYVLNQQVPERGSSGKMDYLVAWFDEAMTPQYLYFSGIVLSRNLLYTKVRNVLNFAGQLETIEVTSSAELMLPAD